MEQNILGAGGKEGAEALRALLDTKHLPVSDVEEIVINDNEPTKISAPPLQQAEAPIKLVSQHLFQAMTAMGLNINQIAEGINESPKKVMRLIAGGDKLFTNEICLKLAWFFGQNDNYWFMARAEYEVGVTNKKIESERKYVKNYREIKDASKPKSTEKEVLKYD